jgi:hypothetical protein
MLFTLWAYSLCNTCGCGLIRPERSLRLSGLGVNMPLWLLHSELSLKEKSSYSCDGPCMVGLLADTDDGTSRC